MLNFLSSNPSIKGLLIIAMYLDVKTDLSSSFYWLILSSLVNKMSVLILSYHFLLRPSISIFPLWIQKVFLKNISNKLNSQDSKYLLLWYIVPHLQFMAPNRMAFLSWFYTVILSNSRFWRYQNLLFWCSFCHQ